MLRHHPQNIFGGGSIGFADVFNEYRDAEGTIKALSILKKGGVTLIDTARAYGRSQARTDPGFAIDAKWTQSFPRRYAH